MSRRRIYRRRAQALSRSALEAEYVRLHMFLDEVQRDVRGVVYQLGAGIDGVNRRFSKVQKKLRKAA